MGLFGTGVVVVQAIRSKPGKIVYRCIKGASLGAPAFVRCAKELFECFIEIDTKKIAGDACKSLLICISPVGTVAGLSLIADMIDHPAAKTMASITGNAAGLIFTGPAYGFDRILSPIETLVFGEPVPIVSGNRLFLFETPFTNNMTNITSNITDIATNITNITSGV